MGKNDLTPPVDGNNVHLIRPGLQNALESRMFGSGNGGDGMLEARVGRLEDDVKELKADMKVVRSDLSELKGRVSMLPGYPGIALIVGVIVGAATIAAKYLPGFPPAP